MTPTSAAAMTSHEPARRLAVDAVTSADAAAVTARRRRPVLTVPWRPVVWALLLQASWEAFGLLVGGDKAYAGPSYDVLRHVPGGMRAYGPILAALVIVAVASFDRCLRGHDSEPLRIVLALLSGWYALWAVGTTSAWVVHRQIIAWPGPARLAVIAFLFVLAARTTPRSTGAAPRR